LGTWLALTLKTAFALIGMGAYVGLFFPQVPILPLAAGFTIVFGAINFFGVKKTGVFQAFLVIGLLLIVFWFTGNGLFQLKTEHFAGLFDKGFGAVYGTAGLVYISYVGLTNIASISEEVKNPEKNLPLGMILALLTAILIYGLGTSVMVGVLSPEDFHHDLTPVASTAELLFGHWGAVLMTIAAVLAFFSVANAAILSASRYPLAMSRDHLIPRIFCALNKYKTPKNAIYFTVAAILFWLVVFDPTKIAKLASAFQLLLFALSCLAVIIMRESRIESYDPGYRSPFYPWMHILGFIAPLVLIVEMGLLPSLFTLALIAMGTGWYFYYARDKVIRDGAIYHMFAHWGEYRFEGLDRELRSILKEKGLREQDPFDAVVANASIIDIGNKVTFGEVVGRAAARLDKKFPGKGELLVVSFMEGTRVGATPVSHSIALPHVRLPDIDHPEMVMVRCHQGVPIEIDDEFLGEHSSPNPIHAFFFLVSPEADPGQHLRILAQIAGHADDEKFMKRWLSARNEQEMKEILLRDDRFISLLLVSDSSTASLIGYAIRDLDLPPGSLIALIHREGEIIFPRGRTVLKEGDRLTIIGEPKGIQQLYARYSE
jgi:amino acid transporter/mannitol/fructose-specific phosphotransferase system IIA component (Ntr-type)